jgi:hypothetical protein
VDLAVDRLVTTWGLPTVSSKPSRRICSTRIASCELAAALDLPGVGAVGGQDADRDVADELAVEAVLDQPAVTLAPLPAGQRRGVVPMVIEMAGSSTVMSGSGAGRRGRRGSRRW